MGGKAKAAAKEAPKAEEVKEEEVEKAPTVVAEVEVGGVLLHFNRRAMLRILQQVGYFMRDQDGLMATVLSADKNGGSDPQNTMSVRQSRYVSVTDKLFE